MKRQLFKFFAMLSLVIMVAFVSALSSVSAQTPTHTIVANIPFEFSVGDKQLSSGEYTVARANQDGSALRIYSRANNEGAIRLTSSVQASKAKGQTILVFNRYGDRYFLSQVWLAGEREGNQMLKSGNERSIAAELARNQASPDTVTVVATMR